MRRPSLLQVARPLPQLLLDLAAGREPDPGSTIDEALLDVAADHRMTGLLWTWARDRHLPTNVTTRLAVADLSMQSNQVRIWQVLQATVSAVGRAGIGVAAIKGVTTEERWYERSGERPCADVDLLLAPDAVSRTRDVVELLDPNHPWIPHLDALVDARAVQSVTLHVDGLEVDLHLDLLKLGTWMRTAEDAWAHRLRYQLPGGETVAVLDETWALFHLLVHLNKDRFQRLLGYADVVRIIRRGGVDWARFDVLVRAEGLELVAAKTLEAVFEDLALPLPTEAPRRASAPLQGWLWGLLWRRSVRLRGSEGRIRFRRRQDLISLFSRGRRREALAWIWRETFPPAALVSIEHSNVGGPYLWRLFRGRGRAWQQKREGLARLRDRERHGCDVP